MNTQLKEPVGLNLETVVEQIKPEWRNEFRRFVDSGDASDEFLAYLDSSEEGKKAVEQAFNAQADALTGLADALRSVQTENVGTEVAKPAEAASVKGDGSGRGPVATAARARQTAGGQSS
jgi:hypothetical protein